MIEVGNSYLRNFKNSWTEIFATKSSENTSLLWNCKKKKLDVDGEGEMHDSSK